MNLTGDIWSFGILDLHFYQHEIHLDMVLEYKNIDTLSHTQKQTDTHSASARV